MRAASQMELERAGAEVSPHVSLGTYFFDSPIAPIAPVPELRAIYGGMEECAPSFSVEREAFPHVVLELVVGGAGRLVLDGRSHPLRPGVLFCYGPRSRVQIATDPENCLRKYFVCVAGRKLKALLSAARLAEGQSRTVAGPFDLQRCWDQLIEEGRSLRSGRREVVAVLLQLLLVKLAHMADVESVPTGRGAEQTFLRCRATIDRHAVRLDSVAAVSIETGVTRAQLSRLFRRFQGESPYRYLLRRRMSLAAERLMQGDCLVKEAARHIGIHDPYHFSRLFKQVYHVAPSAFVQRVLQGRV